MMQSRGLGLMRQSRFKGYKSCYVRELLVKAELVHYRRECWLTPDGKTRIAPLPAGIMGGYGPNLRRLCLMLHAQGQVTTERLTTLLNAIGITISKRQVVRLLTGDLDGFIAEDAAVLHTGLVSAPFITVDDTGARHAHDNCYTTQIGGDHFTAFRTRPTKSRLIFLSLLTGNYQDYVLGDAAFNYIERRQADPALLARQRTREPQRFCVGARALCWVHAERLLQKLMPATPRQAEQQVDAIRELVWCFYKALKAFRDKRSPRFGHALRQRASMPSSRSVPAMTSSTGC